MTINVGQTPRTVIHRAPSKTVTDKQVVYDILDAGLVANVACVVDGQPYVLPVGYARDGDRVLFHGSNASRLFKVLATGVPTCFSVTLLDGLVLARSAFESSMNYRSVMVLGSCVKLEGQEKEDALIRITDYLLPGRTEHARVSAPKESAATLMLALSLDECSCKVSDKFPEDDPDDLIDPEYSNIWAGYVPIREVFGEPVPDPMTVEKNIAVPDYVREWKR
jgi:nitroimidazol reductase NimA-like FMN-containing flavoprotein (pyridoxamine 5'-phosphate oxidase superfamily)